MEARNVSVNWRGKGEQVRRCKGSKSNLQGGEDSMGLADDAYDDGTLLDGFLCVFDLEDTALWRAGKGSVGGPVCLIMANIQSDGIVVIVVSEHCGGEAM